MLLGLALYLAHRCLPSVKNFLAKLQTRCMLVKLKQMATFFQIVLLLPNVYIVPYPTSYIVFLKVRSNSSVQLLLPPTA